MSGLRSLSFDADLNRLERAKKLIYGRLWGSGNWTPRGGELAYSKLIAMSAAYGGLRFKRLIITKSVFREKLESGRYSHYGNQSDHHSRLKAVAIAVLNEWGHADAIDEYPFKGGRVDVASKKGNIYVECGDTDPQRIIDISLLEDAKGYLVPYSRQNEAACWEPYEDIHFYRFELTEPARKALKVMDEVQRQEMAKKWQRIKNDRTPG